MSTERSLYQQGYQKTHFLTLYPIAILVILHREFPNKTCFLVLSVIFNHDPALETIWKLSIWQLNSTYKYLFPTLKAILLLFFLLFLLLLKINILCFLKYKIAQRNDGEESGLKIFNSYKLYVCMHILLSNLLNILPTAQSLFFFSNFVEYNEK